MCFEGMMYQTTHFGDLIITKYVSARNVHVRFINTGYETTTEMGKIRNGGVKDRLAPSVFGIGVIGDAPISVNGKTLKEYALWGNVLARCYDENFHSKVPSYLGCSVSSNFRYFPYFKDWCSKQIGFDSKDEKGRSFALDKDILVKGNKVYSEDTCCFVPQEINTLFMRKRAVGDDSKNSPFFSKYHDRYISRMSKFGKFVHLGTFTSQTEAFSLYKDTKEVYIKEIANKWKDQIDPRVYDVLMNWEVQY